MFLLSFCRFYAMLLCLYYRSSQAKLLKTDEVDEAFNVTEKKPNSITDFFFGNIT